MVVRETFETLDSYGFKNINKIVFPLKSFFPMLLYKHSISIKSALV
jgi:hypothetical protein